jgi:glycosyltransferase involved in cell wall biosynthesis
MTAGALEALPDGAGRVVEPARNEGPVLLLAPSRGLGGGIERYVRTVEAAFADQGVTCRRLDLPRPRWAGHWALLAATAAALPPVAGPVPAGTAARLIVAHRALLPVAAVLSQIRRVSGISVLCHGAEVWGSGSGLRWQLERSLMRRRDTRIVAVSSFTAGALFPGVTATILPPGLSRAWFAELVNASAAERPRRAGLVLTTAFRLHDWRDKGLPQLIAAVAALGRDDVRLTVCGSGRPPADLLAYVGGYPWCTVRPELTDSELAAQLAFCDLFVLATRTRSGRRSCGEGFGLVLLEAQVAGTAVVGPAHGGSLGAYLDGVTGATPRDETVAALTQVLAELTGRPDRLGEMGARGAAWARASFAPDRYAALAVDRLL